MPVFFVFLLVATLVGFQSPAQCDDTLRVFTTNLIRLVHDRPDNFENDTADSIRTAHHMSAMINNPAVDAHTRDSYVALFEQELFIQHFKAPSLLAVLTETFHHPDPKTADLAFRLAANYQKAHHTLIPGAIFEAIRVLNEYPYYAKRDQSHSALGFLYSALWNKIKYSPEETLLIRLALANVPELIEGKALREALLNCSDHLTPGSETKSPDSTPDPDSR